MPVDALGEAIAELAARIHAATYELLVMIRQFDADAGWSNGFLSCAHWLNWRTGIDLGAAREKVRVARALATLPLVSAALQRGTVSYAKVRAITRVATSDTEQRLLEVALSGTASHVEHVVRAWRRVDRVVAAEQANARHLSRHLTTWIDDDGMLVVRGRLTPEIGAVLHRALEAAADQLYRDAKAAPDAGGVANEVSWGQRRADALGRLAEVALAADLDAGTAGDRYQVVLHVDATPTTEADVPSFDGALEVDDAAVRVPLPLVPPPPQWARWEGRAPLAPTTERLARHGITIGPRTLPTWDGTPFNVVHAIDVLYVPPAHTAPASAP